MRRGRRRQNVTSRRAEREGGRLSQNCLLSVDTARLGPGSGICLIWMGAAQRGEVQLRPWFPPSEALSFGSPRKWMEIYAHSEKRMNADGEWIGGGEGWGNKSTALYFPHATEGKSGSD